MTCYPGCPWPEKISCDKIFSCTSYLPLRLSCGLVRLLPTCRISGLVMDKTGGCAVGTVHEEPDFVFSLCAYRSGKEITNNFTYCEGIVLELSNPLPFYGHEGTILPGFEMPKSVSLRIYFSLGWSKFQGRAVGFLFFLG